MAAIKKRAEHCVSSAYFYSYSKEKTRQIFLPGGVGIGKENGMHESEKKCIGIDVGGTSVKIGLFETENQASTCWIPARSQP